MDEQNTLHTIFSLLQMLCGCITALATVITALGALWSARAAQQATYETRLNTKAQVINGLWDAYASPTTHDAIQIVMNWEREHGDNFADEFRKLRQANFEKVKALDYARRHLAHHYEKVFALLQEKVIDKEHVSRLLSKEQTEFMRSLVEPLEKALNPNYNHVIFDELGKIHGVGPREFPIANPQK